MTQHERDHHRGLWLRREAALRGPTLPVIWAIVDRGVKLTLAGERVLADPPGQLRPDELAVLREHPADTRLLVELAAGDVEVANYQVQ